MINTYLGQFNNLDELKAHNKQLKVAEYRNLAKRFANNPSMELSSLLSDLSLVLVNQFGFSWAEVEALETV